MGIRLSTRGHIRPIYTGIALLMCWLALTFAGCGHQITNGTALSTATVPQPPLDTMEGNIPQAELAKVQKIIAGMSLEQKLGQLLVVEYVGNSYQGSGLQYMITQQFVGGFIYQPVNHNFDPPYNTINSLADFSRRAMQDAAIPLLIATDQEGGQVSRLQTFHGYLPSAEQMGVTGNFHIALAQGTQDARWMLQLGMNADLAPVVDVQTVDPPVLATRMFGRDPQTVTTFAGAFLSGLQNNGVPGCLKHFPGLGAVTLDPHMGLPVVTRSLADLEKIDLAPYELMIPKYHPAMIMVTDVLMPAIDPTLPAELSPKAVNGVLRRQLGYNGVVITDGVHMGGISDRWNSKEAAVLAILAGDDLIESPSSPAEVAGILTAFKQAIQRGQLTIDRINQSVERILLMKLQYRIIVK